MSENKRLRVEINSPNKPKLLRMNDIAKELGIGLSTAWKWHKEGKLPKCHAKLSAKCTVWKASDIDDFINDLANNPNSEFDRLNFNRSKK
jgi:predicted DNA-binding transcriptional regulator AlpA